MHYEIIGRYFNVFFVEIQLKKKNLKFFLGGLHSLGAQASIPVSQTAWICHCKRQSHEVVRHTQTVRRQFVQ